MRALLVRRLHRVRFTLIVAGLCLTAGGGSATQGGESLVPRLDVTRGLCVVLGDLQGDAAVQLARDSELLIYVQLPRAEQVAAARQTAAEAGFYGTRIYVEQGDLARLYLADNLADALIATPDSAGLPEAEVLRVLRPQGKAILGGRELVKPIPEGVDDWSHPYHGPDNNPQSEDRLARGPYLTQFLAEPWYVPFPEVTVTAAGRVFKAFGHVGYKERDWPWLQATFGQGIQLSTRPYAGQPGYEFWRFPLSVMTNIPIRKAKMIAGRV